MEISTLHLYINESIEISYGPTSDHEFTDNTYALIGWVISSYKIQEKLPERKRKQYSTESLLEKIIRILHCGQTSSACAKWENVVQGSVCVEKWKCIFS